MPSSSSANDSPENSTEHSTEFSAKASVPELVLCGAFVPEIAPLLDLDGRLIRLPGGDVFRVRIRETGIGNLRAALSLVRWVQDFHPVEVVFLGSCGVYEAISSGATAVPLPGSPAPSSGDLPYLVFSQVFLSRELSCFEGRAKALDASGAAIRSTPGRLGRLIESRLDAARPFPSPESVINCPGAVSLVGLDPSIIVAKTGLAGRFFENLEAYGLAHAAAESGICFSVLLGVTNRVGPQGSTEWASNHREAADLVCRFIRDLLIVEAD